MKVSTGLQTEGRFYQVELDAADGRRALGGAKFDALHPLKQSLALGILGDMAACTYAKANHLMVADYDGRMSELKVQLSAVISDG